MQTYKCFRYDRWIDIPPTEMEPGDQFVQAGMLIQVSAKPRMEGDVLKIDAKRGENPATTVLLDDSIFTKCMDLTGTGLLNFQDGSALLADLSCPAGHVYSPRLPKVELEAFCTEHLDRYKAFYAKHQDDIDEGVPVYMTPWWEPARAIS